MDPLRSKTSPLEKCVVLNLIVDPLRLRPLDPPTIPPSPWLHPTKSDFLKKKKKKKTRVALGSLDQKHVGLNLTNQYSTLTSIHIH